MRYYIKCKLNSKDKQKLRDSLKNGSLGSGKIFYEGMQTALREGTIDDDDVVHFIEICYCLESGLYPMAMEIPELNKYFEDVVEVKDARLRNYCTMEYEFCDCTRNVKLPGKSLVEELCMDKEIESEKETFVDIGRIKLNRKKQGMGIQGLRNVIEKLKNGNNVKPIFAAAAISGLFAIFYDYNDDDYLRIKNISDTAEAKKMLKSIGLDVCYDVESMKTAAAKSSIAKGYKWSNVVQHIIFTNAFEFIMSPKPVIILKAMAIPFEKLVKQLFEKVYLNEHPENINKILSNVIIQALCSHNPERVVP